MIAIEAASIMIPDFSDAVPDSRNLGPEIALSMTLNAAGRTANTVKSVFSVPVCWYRKRLQAGSWHGGGSSLPGYG
jgi:hypothetical protein